MRFIVLFDACVLYPAPLRDFLLRLGQSGLFAIKWTEQIHQEWISKLIKSRPELNSSIQRTKLLMNRAIPDCLVTGYENLIQGLNLPDPNDNHVLAAAIRCAAQMIVTFNLKDFPEAVLSGYGIEAIHPDVFVEHQFGLHQGIVIATAKKHRAALKNPVKSPEEYLDTLASQGLVVTAKQLWEFIDLI
jgi:predicted nucleic acid-binding protein